MKPRTAREAAQTAAWVMALVATLLVVSEVRGQGRRRDYGRPQDARVRRRRPTRSFGEAELQALGTEAVDARGSEPTKKTD